MKHDENSFEQTATHRMQYEIAISDTGKGTLKFDLLLLIETNRTRLAGPPITRLDLAPQYFQLNQLDGH